MPKQPCPTCGQNVAKRKVVFHRNMVTGLVKAMKNCAQRQSSQFRISDLDLTNSEYARMNDLVRFGLLFKTEAMGNGVYGLPYSRVDEFLSGEYSVAQYYWHDPLTGENEMSHDRLFVGQVPGVLELQREMGIKLTEYKS